MSNTKIKRKRDYRAEYKRRIERGLARGFTRSQARGHPKASEKYIEAPNPIPDKALQISLKLLRSGKSLSEAAWEIRVSPARLRNQAKAKGAIKKKGQRWIVKATLPRKMLIYSNGESLAITVGKFSQASKVGQYMAAVKRFLRSSDITHLKPFNKKSVTDSRGKTYPLETNPNALFRLAASGSETFEQVYRIII